MKYIRIIKRLPGLMLLIFVSTTIAQNSDAGRVYFPFLNLDYDAQSVAMAGASCAIQSDLYGINSNPATIAYIKNQQAFIGYRPIVLDVWGGASCVWFTN